MKKQPKQKQKPKNRPKRRPKAQSHRPSRADHMASDRRTDAAERFKRDFLSAVTMMHSGDLQEGLERLYEALARCTDSSVRNSRPYLNAQGLAARLTTGLRLPLIASGRAPVLLAHTLGTLPRALSLHVSLASFETALTTLDTEGALRFGERISPMIRDLEHHHEAGFVALSNILGTHFFTIGDSAEAERQWQIVRQSLRRSGRLDAAADRLLASNIAVARWRIGDEAGAIASLERSLQTMPLSTDDCPRSLYPLVGYAELLRHADRTQDAARVLQQLQPRLGPPRPADLLVGTLEECQDFPGADELVRSADLFATTDRTYIPPCSGPKPFRAWERDFDSRMFYGSAPGVISVDWCTPEELLALHGPDDELLLASVRIQSMMAHSERNPLAVRHLTRARELLEQQAPDAALLRELRVQEKSALNQLEVGL
jgi:plasmid stabilization system protein ParE